MSKSNDQFLYDKNIDLTWHCKKKRNFPLKIYLVNVAKSAVSADLGTFTEEVLNEKLHYFVHCGFSIFLAEQKQTKNSRTLTALSTTENLDSVTETG